MGKVWQPQTIEVLRAWVEAINTEASDQLTPWEIDFMENMTFRVNSRRNLTQPQEETLERIYTKYTK